MIVVQLKGGLGNQLFQYAVGRMLSLTHRTELSFDTSFLANRVPDKAKTFYNFELRHFSLPARIATQADIPFYSGRFSTRNRFTRGLHVLQIHARGFRYILQRQFEFDPRILALPDNVYLDGYWQTERYFQIVANQLRTDLDIRFPLSPVARQMQVQMQTTTSVCVHIRRGDYMEVVSQVGVVGADYIQAGIQHLAERFSGLHFYVFSNDPQWCIENLKIIHPHTFITPDNAGENDKEHFMLMSSAQHFIIANSTYSWWAAWLAKNTTKIVIGPKTWSLDPKKNTNDVMPESWLRL